LKDSRVSGAGSRSSERRWIDETDEVLVMAKSPCCEQSLTEGGAILLDDSSYVFGSLLLLPLLARQTDLQLPQ
jgi:hypothetical protein